MTHKNSCADANTVYIPEETTELNIKIYAVSDAVHAFICDFLACKLR